MIDIIGIIFVLTAVYFFFGFVTAAVLEDKSFTFTKATRANNYTTHMTSYGTFILLTWPLTAIRGLYRFVKRVSQATRENFTTWKAS